MSYEDTLLTNAKFSMELTSFVLVKKESPRWPGKKLRFTLKWQVKIPPVNAEINTTEENLEIVVTGCLARILPSGELIWLPPQSRSGSYYANTVFVSPELYERVRKAIVESKYYAIIKPLDLEEPISEIKKIDPDAPEVIKA